MTIKQIQDSIEKGVNLKLVAEAYGEIASIRLRKIRNNVETNRYFLEDISKIYATIQQVAAMKRMTPPKHKKKSQFSVNI